MRYISVFSGIEAASVAFRPLGWEPVAFSEIDPFPCAVLRERFPSVPNLGDISEVDWKPYRGKVDLVVGGSPCQSFSISGKREGLSGKSGLMFEFIRCVREVRPRWFLWENVPGALSVDGGAAFGQLLNEMADGGGYGCAWRVLDAQFFGVAQRRRRLFLVGRAGNGYKEACQVLFEPSCVLGSPAEGKEKRAELAACSGRDVNTTVSVGIAANQRGEVRLDGGDGATIGAIPATRSGKQLQGVLTMASGQANAEIGEDMCPTQSARQYKDPPIVLSDLNTRGAIDVDVAGTLKVGGEVPSVMTRDVVSHAE